MPALAGWGLWGLGTLIFLAAVWVNELLRRAGRPDLAELTLGDTLPLLLASLSSATVGAVLVSRRSRHPVGWLLLGLGVSLIALGLAQDYASLDLLAGAGPLPGAAGRPCSPTPAGSCGRPRSASSCCSPRPGRRRRPAGAGGCG